LGIAERLLWIEQIDKLVDRNLPVGARQNSLKHAFKNESQQLSGSKANRAA
jgi:hypothetical protein